ncbi:MAG: Crp/Fnr family transcriptional regulator [Ignavibacteriaceae bacterium]|nr:Crp/Fnr family transcriptional regulator [Ignavibacteriaceae bacterium]
MKKALEPADPDSAGFKKLALYIGSLVNFTPDEFSGYAEYFGHETIKRNRHFINEGDVCEKLSFIISGMFRFYEISDGEEITTDFSFENSFITSYISLITSEPSQLFIQAMEDSELLTLHISDLRRLYDIDQRFERTGRLIAEQVFIDNSRRLTSVLKDPAELRYKNLLSRSPHLVQMIPLRYIASYLGIAPETLSRIRKRI